MGDERLIEVFEDARDRGLLGPGPVRAHIEHADAIARIVGPQRGRFLDLGSGAGVPGLVLASRWPESRPVLLDAAERRCRFLRAAAERLGLGERVAVRCGRAEELAREPDLRASFPLVVARGFSSPPVVAECAVGFVAPGGRIAVSEPPADAQDVERRWPPAGLDRLGLRVAGMLRDPGAGLVELALDGPVADRWPRRVGIPRKRPLW